MFSCRQYMPKYDIIPLIIPTKKHHVSPFPLRLSFLSHWSFHLPPIRSLPFLCTAHYYYFPHPPIITFHILLSPPSPFPHSIRSNPLSHQIPLPSSSLPYHCIPSHLLFPFPLSSITPSLFHWSFSITFPSLLHPHHHLPFLWPSPSIPIILIKRNKKSFNFQHLCFLESL